MTGRWSHPSLQRDIVFEGILAILVSLLFIYVSAIEIPFYPVEARVQTAAAASLVIGVIITLFGIVYGRKSHS